MMVSPAEVAAGPASPATTSRSDRRGERVNQRAGELLHVPYLARSPSSLAGGELPGSMAADG
jgi:hypothetical protein